MNNAILHPNIDLLHRPKINIAPIIFHAPFKEAYLHIRWSNCDEQSWFHCKQGYFWILRIYSAEPRRDIVATWISFTHHIRMKHIQKYRCKKVWLVAIVSVIGTDFAPKSKRGAARRINWLLLKPQWASTLRICYSVNQIYSVLKDYENHHRDCCLVVMAEQCMSYGLWGIHENIPGASVRYNW